MAPSYFCIGGPKVPRQRGGRKGGERYRPCSAIGSALLPAAHRACVLTASLGQARRSRAARPHRPLDSFNVALIDFIPRRSQHHSDSEACPSSFGVKEIERKKESAPAC